MLDGIVVEHRNRGALRAGRARQEAEQGQQEELTLEVFDSLEHAPAQWSELAERAGNVFSTPEWASVWWRHFGAGRPLALHACRDRGGGLAAVLPLYLARRLPLRVLRFIGHGPADQLGPVCDPTAVGQVSAVLRSALARRALPWDLFIGDRLPGGRDWPTLIGGKSLRQEPSPVLEIEGATWEQFLATRSANFREQARRRERKLAREHEVTFRLADRSSLESDLDTLLSLHDMRWGGGSPAFVDRLEAFHREFADVALERGWLRLWMLEVDGSPVAAWHGFRFGGFDSYYQSGRDPGWDRYRVGFVLLVHTIREAFHDGMREYRLLRGGEEYKDRFATRDQGVETVTATRGLGRPGYAIGAAAQRAIPYRLRRRLAGLTE
jgi:CelD/BcsL family acetyltransferase involved in cellulose biosynthesis